MEGPRAVKTGEFEETINLINAVFRESCGLAPTIQYEFPTLLNRHNCANMRAIFDNGMPTAVVSFYKTVLSIYGTPINLACVGAVTTHPNYRRKGLATSLLIDGEKKMVSEGVDLIVISGNNSVYTGQNYNSVIEYINFSVNSGSHTIENNKLVLRDITDDNFNEIIKLYIKEPIRCCREYDEFCQLYSGALYEWNGRRHKAVLLESDNTIIGYLIIRVKGAGKEGELIEYAGDRRIVYIGLRRLCDLLNLEEIKCSITPDDMQMADILTENGIETQKITCLHTIKVVNFVGLMNKLNNYFSQVIDGRILKELSFDYDGSYYTIRLGNEEIKFDDVKVLNSILFGGGLQIYDILKEKPELKDFMDSVFPIRLPYVKNLNYI